MASINLYGKLRRDFEKKFGTSGRNLKIRVKSGTEAIRALEANFEGFNTLINRRGGYAFATGNDIYDTQIGAMDLGAKSTSSDWHIMPVAHGSSGKSIAIGLIIIGLIIVTVATWGSGTGPYLGMSSAAWGSAMGAASALGVGMALAGVGMLLAPSPPKQKGGGGGDPSYLFDTAFNNTTTGYPVPLIFGEVYAGSTTVSLGAEQELIKKNNMKSKTILDIVDVLSEGEILGPANTDIYKSVYLNKTVVKNDDDTTNFDGVTAELLTGPPDPSQAIIQHFDPDLFGEAAQTVRATTNVGVTLNAGGDNTTRAVADGITDLNITLECPQGLIVIYDSGNHRNRKITYRITVTPTVGTPYVLNTEIETKSYSPIRWDEEIKDLPSIGTGPYSVNVRRTSVAGESSKKGSYVDAFGWTSFTEITKVRLQYYERAAVALRIDAEDFNEPVPDIIYHVRGLKVQIPDNYTPDVEGGGTYFGIWGGDFAANKEYTTNPAWIIYAIATNTKWGIGLDPDEVDKFGLYSISQYNDGTAVADARILNTTTNVYDDYPVIEPRFTFNAQIGNTEQALAMLSHVCSTCNCYPVWVDGTLTFIQDRPTTFTRIATPANVRDGLFTYVGTDRRVRHTVATVSWNDPDNFNARDTIIVEDEQGIIDYGYNELQLDLIGCTSRFEAIRKARYYLYTDLEQTQTLTFDGGSEWSDALPGEVIKVEDPDWSGAEGMGGRIVSSTTTSLVTDRPVTIPAGTTLIYIAQSEAEAVERTLTNAPGVTSTLTWTTPLSAAPQQDNTWAVSFEDPEPALRTFKILGVVENGVADYTITALEYNSLKWDYIEDPDQVVEEPPTTTFKVGALDPPSNLNVDGYSYVDGDSSNRKYDIFLSWTPSPDTRTSSYEIFYTFNDGPRFPLSTTGGISFTWQDVEAGTYDFYIRATSPVGQSPFIIYADYTMLTDTGAPNPPVNLRTDAGTDEWGGKDANILWDSPEDSTSLITVVTDGTATLDVMNINAGTISSFRVEVYDTDTLTLRRTYQTASAVETEFTYLYSMNQEDFGGVPERELTFKIYSVGYNATISTALTRALSNPIPTMASAKPDCTSRPTYMKVEWPLVADNDMSHYDIYLDTTASDPVTFQGTLNDPGDTFNVHGLLAGTTYYAKVIPFDGFGEGIESQISDPETVLVIPDVNVELELVDSITMTQDAAAFVGTLTDLYNRVVNTGGVTSTNPNGHWIDYKYKIENYFDRVGIWSANANARVYPALSTDGITYTFYKCATGHLPDADYNLVQATNQADAISFYWQLSAGLNVAYFPNNQTAKYVRLYFVNTNSTQIYEYVPSRILISELAAIEHLSAISADVGTVIAGYLQSTNLSTTIGTEISLNDSEIVLGGTSDRDIVLDGDTSTITVGTGGTIQMGESSVINMADQSAFYMGEDSFIRVSNNVQISENSDSLGEIIVADEKAQAATGKLSLTSIDYTKIDDGGIQTYIWDPITGQHVNYQNLSRIEAGTAKNGLWCYIPGIFKTQPQVILSPNVLKSYDNRYKERTQTFKLEVTRMTQYNTYRWRFVPSAVLELEGGTFSFNANKYNQNKDPNWGNNAYVSYGTQIQLAPGVRKVTANVTSWAFTIENQSNYPRAGWAQWYVYLQGYYAGAWSNLNYLGPLGGVITALGAMNPGPINSTLISGLAGSDISWIRLAMYTFNHEPRTKGMKTSISGLSPAPYYGAWHRMTLNSYTTQTVNSPQLSSGTVNWLAIGM